jgi:hypothetical protein
MVGKKLMRSAAFLWVFLAACSGGGGSGNNTSDSPSTVQGTAAIGKPISLGNVVLKCATGERTATTQPDGRYRIELSGLALPCTMQVSGGQIAEQPSDWLLTSTVTAPGVANLTPWTHLVMARLIAADPASANMSATQMPSLLSTEKLTRAVEGVRQEMSRLLGNPPDAEIDPITTAFTATPGDSMDGLLELIMSGLAASQNSSRPSPQHLAQAAQEIAKGPLNVPQVPAGCKPGVFSGFKRGNFNDVPLSDDRITVPPRPSSGDNTGEGGGGAGDGGGSDGAGAGAGGSLGQFANTIVLAETVDGPLGRATTGDDGMVTMVTCDYRGRPLHVTMKAKDDGSSRYFEESTGKLTPFPKGTTMHAVVPAVDKNIGVTLLTESAWQYLQAKHGPNGWKNPDQVRAANEVIRTEFNKILPKELQIKDITRLPALVGLRTKVASLGSSDNDIYAIVSSGLARAAGLMRSGDLEPALKLVRQLGRDLCDGSIDLMGCDGTPDKPKPVVDNAADAAYLPAQFAETLNRGVGEVAAKCGTPDAAKKAFAVTQISIGARGELDANNQETSFVSSYHSKQPIHLLRSDGKAFFWPTRSAPITPYLPQYSFDRLFPQSAFEFAGMTPQGEFVTQSGSGVGQPEVIATQAPWARATTVGGYAEHEYRRTQITRLANGDISYFPHYDQVDAQGAGARTNVIKLPNVVAVSVAMGELAGFDALVYDNAFPTFYAVTAQGEVYAWGNDRLSALGDGKNPPKDSRFIQTLAPQKISGLPPIVSVHGIKDGAFALDTQGRVWQWGFTGVDQSLIPGVDASAPVEVKLFEQFGRITQINCAVGRMCAALTNAGAMLVWGYFGESYDGIKKFPLQKFDLAPITLPAGRRVTYLGASKGMVYALLDDGKIVVFPSYPNVPEFLDLAAKLPAAPPSAASASACLPETVAGSN